MKKVITSIVFLLFITILPSTAYASSYIMHTVKEGETLDTIAKDYKVSNNQLSKLNYGADLYVGNLIRIRPIGGERTIQVYLNERVIACDQSPYMEGGRTLVPIRFIAEAIGIDEINWDEAREEAVLIKDEVILRLPLRNNIAFINDESYELDAAINVYNGRTFVPIRFVSEVFEVDVKWDQTTSSVKLYTKDYIEVNRPDVLLSPVTSSTYSEEDLYWLSRLVHAEAEAEPFEGKLAVANCVINRKKSKDFPNTIKGVIFDRNWGVQYTPVANGRIYNNPSEDSIKAARMALEGNNNIGECIYFLNPKKSTSNWIIKNRTFYRRINNHDFYL